MKTYEMLFNRDLMNEYIEGCIAGVIYVLKCMPDGDGYVIMRNGADAMVQFHATEEQAAAVAKCLNKMWPDIYVGMKEAE